MFLWFELREPGADAERVQAEALRRGVAPVPGAFFSARQLLTPQQPLNCPCFRVSFAGLADEQMDEGFRRLRAAIDAAARPPNQLQ